MWPSLPAAKLNQITDKAATAPRAAAIHDVIRRDREKACRGPAITLTLSSLTAAPDPLSRCEHSCRDCDLTLLHHAVEQRGAIGSATAVGLTRPGHSDASVVLLARQVRTQWQSPPRRRRREDHRNTTRLDRNLRVPRSAGFASNGTRRVNPNHLVGLTTFSTSWRIRHLSAIPVRKPAVSRNSHRNGRRDFLIVVANPRTVRSCSSAAPPGGVAARNLCCADFRRATRSSIPSPTAIDCGAPPHPRDLLSSPPIAPRRDGPTDPQPGRVSRTARTPACRRHRARRCVWPRRPR